MFPRASRESIGMIISCMGGDTILSMVSPALLLGAIGKLLLGGALLAAILTVVIEVRHGVGVLKSLIGVVVVGFFTFAFTWIPRCCLAC